MVNFLAKIIGKQKGKADDIIASADIVWARIPDRFICMLEYYRSRLPKARLTLDRDKMPIPVPMKYKRKNKD